MAASSYRCCLGHVLAVLWLLLVCLSLWVVPGVLIAGLQQATCCVSCLRRTAMHSVTLPFKNAVLFAARVPVAAKHHAAAAAADLQEAPMAPVAPALRT